MWSQGHPGRVNFTWSSSNDPRTQVIYTNGFSVALPWNDHIVIGYYFGSFRSEITYSKLRTDIDARGGIAVIDWINENREYWGGTPKYQRTVAADKLSEMLKNDDISIQQAQQVLNQEFFAWDGCKQTVYNQEEPNKTSRTFRD